MPSSEYEKVTIRVSDKVLYVGSGTAYPLAGIVRVQWERLKIVRWRYLRVILVNILLLLIVWLVLAGIGKLFAGGLVTFADGSTSSPSPPGWVELVQFAALVFFIIRSVEPGRMLLLSRDVYFVLSIDTAGSVGSRVINPDGEELGGIAKQIIDAIDNPAAEWQMQVNNYHVGDTINQTGPESIGKVIP